MSNPFSSKNRIFVGLTTVPVLKEQKIFNEHILKAIFNGLSMADGIIDDLKNGWVSKANRYYRQAKKNLQTGDERAIYTSIDSEVTDNISTALGTPANLLETHTGLYDPIYSAYDYIFQNYTIDLTNDMVYGVISNSWIKFTGALDKGDILTIIFTLDDATEHTIDIPHVNTLTGNILHVMYTTTEDPYTPRIWLYELDSNIHPSINNSIDTKVFTDYYPTVALIRNHEPVYGSNSDYSKKANKVLRRVGLDMKAITEQLTSNEDGANANVLNAAYIAFNLNIQDDYVGSMLYFFEYFKSVHQSNPNSKNKFENWINSPKTVRPVNSIRFKDDGFNSYITWNYIEHNIISGSLGKNKSTKETIIKDDYKSKGYIDALGKIRWYYISDSSIIYRKRIDNNSYEEVIVHGLLHVTDIIDGMNVVRSLADSLNKPNENSTDDSGFTIPVSKSIVDRLPFVYRKQTLYAALVIPMYTKQVVKIKWYQRGAFQIVLAIVAIVITIWFDYTGTIGEFLIALAYNIASSIILMALLKIVVKVLGIENSLIVAVIVAAYAIYNGGLSADGLPWAQELLQLATLTVSAASMAIKDKLVDLQNEMDDFLLSAKEKNEELKNAAALLDNSKYDFWEIKTNNMYFDPYETPDEFYYRTIGLQNPGVLIYDLLYTYADRMVQPPKHKDFIPKVIDT